MDDQEGPGGVGVELEWGGKNGRVAVLIGWDLGEKMMEDGSLGQECVFGVKCLFGV